MNHQLFGWMLPLLAAAPLGKRRRAAGWYASTEPSSLIKQLTGEFSSWWLLLRCCWSCEPTLYSAA